MFLFKQHVIYLTTHVDYFTGIEAGYIITTSQRDVAFLVGESL